MSGILERLRAALTDRYTIERELGRGGMATVFLARDVRHKRPVALKVLHAELAATLGPERFQREIELAARLQHPHILTVHDSGEVPAPSGTPPILWFTMPFVEGETLRSRLNREKQLPIEDALRIARQAADALDYAHRHGVVHRDIKPENILLTGSHALVADFGIGKALGAGAEERLTETGLSVGTPAYMSPEQASGERDLDGRTDVYSLAVVLYEMLAGQPPFTGPTAQAILAQRFTETPRPVRALRDTVPRVVDEAIARALARAPADRFATAQEFGRALQADAGTVATTHPPIRPPAHRRPTRGLVLLGLGFLLGLGVLFAWRRTHPGSEEAPAGVKAIAVLPFENLGAPEDDYFADGMTDAVRGKLAAVPGLQVIARTSSAPYKKTAKTPQEIGRELGVRYILTATVRWGKTGAGPSRVQVSPELVQVSDGAAPTTEWQQPFDATITDVFQVQADIASRVAQALDVALGATARETITEKPTRNVAAYDAFLKGNEVAGSFITATAGELKSAIAHYERAVALDSSFALAWVQLSRAHANTSPVTPADRMESRIAAERARALAPTAPSTYLAWGDYYSQVLRDLPRALEQYTLGRRAAPNDADLLAGIALVERSRGHLEQSLASLRQALALDPRATGTARRIAQTLMWLKRYPEALDAADKALALNPRSPDLLETKAMVFLAQGDLPGARAVLQNNRADPIELVAYVATFWDLFWVLDDTQQELLLRLTPEPFGDDLSNWAICLTQTYAVRGDAVRARAYADTARAAAEAQLREAPDDDARHALLGLALGYMGRTAEAIREGERAVALGPVDRDAYQGAYFLHQLARIYTMAGESDKAIDLLERLLAMPYYLSPAWLRIDPTLDPLRKHPRFQRLVERPLSA